MTPPAGWGEDELAESVAIEQMEELGWAHLDCYQEWATGDSFLGRETMEEVVLVDRLQPALALLNPDLPPEALTQAIEELTRHRGMLSLAEANSQIYKLITDGVKVRYRNDEGVETYATVRIIDWNNPDNNDFFLASQFWIAGEFGNKRPDAIGFVNGLPLVLMEFKRPSVNVKEAYDKNISDYKDTIPQVFWYNALVIASNARVSRVGSATARWEHFTHWKRINTEKDQPDFSLQTMLRGTCAFDKLLDIVENFTLFKEERGGLIKIVAKNHQYIGVNQAFEGVRNYKQHNGRLGVFWHTQGSGKSFSMIFLSRKVHRKLPGHWTFVVITDALDLDDQIYKNFARTGTVTEEEAKARDGEHLQQLLTEDHRYIFTLIQKFRTRERGMVYPQVSSREDIIVMVDEAHRSQYDTLAQNMRNALPNASFIGFTGTPLMLKGEEKTRDQFGDYVSVYDFQEAIDDEVNVPLYYENRKPELQIVNPNINREMAEILDRANLNPEEERRLEREFSAEYHLITRNERLNEIALDIVEHFMGRGFRGKAMVVAIDKATAIRMYDKVRICWQRHIDALRQRLPEASDEEKIIIEETIEFMEGTDMAVVVSKDQNEIENMRRKGLDISNHRRRMENEALDEKFKDPGDPFRIVFVCAMWMTGFDAPSCSTIYLDKPMRNHTLMQTIARGNRVFPGKENGLVIDYFGVFQNLQNALAIYAAGTPESTDGVREDGQIPIRQKEQQMEDLLEAIADTRTFCEERHIDLDAALRADRIQRVRMLDDAVIQIILRNPEYFEGEVGDQIDAILVNDDSRREFLMLADQVTRLSKAIRPYEPLNEYIPICTLFTVIAETIRSITPPPDISGVMGDVERLLDRSISSRGYIIRSGGVLDLSRVDVDALRARISTVNHRNIEATQLRGLVQRTIEQIVQRNRTRIDYYHRFQRLVNRYNSNSLNVEEFFRQLVNLIQDLTEEDQRAIAENLTEEQLAIFDLLITPGPELNEAQSNQVKEVVRDLLATLKEEKLLLDWQKKRTLRAGVRLAIMDKLEELPDAYNPEQYELKCSLIYDHVLNSYFGDGRSIYSAEV